MVCVLQLQQLTQQQLQQFPGGVVYKVARITVAVWLHAQNIMIKGLGANSKIFKDLENIQKFEAQLSQA